MPQIGPLEILVIFIVALLVFGPKEIPRVARQAAKAWREVQRFQASVRRDIDDVLREVDEEEEKEKQRGRPPPVPGPMPPARSPPTPDRRLIPRRSRRAQTRRRRPDDGRRAPGRATPPHHGVPRGGDARRHRRLHLLA